MSVLQIKEELHRFIDIADPKFLSAVYAMMENYLQNNQSIVAYTPEGKPLTKVEFIQHVREAHDDVTKGNYITSEELKKEMKNW